jgi:hypothetical protein
VFLDDAEIGYHRFTLAEAGAERVLRSEARFEVKFLLFTAYRYAHDADERWRDGCLTRLESRTRDNGARYRVRGRRGRRASRWRPRTAGGRCRPAS